MTLRSFCLITAIVLAVTTAAHAAKIFDGYGELAWGTHLHQVMNAYPKGKMEEYNKEIIYTQENPDETIASRLFAFRNGKLSGVAVTFYANYVRKTDLENLKQNYVKQYGQGKPAGNAGHMVSYGWETKKSRITFVYVPNKPEMTVIQYEQKQKK